MPEPLRLRADGHELEALWIGPGPDAAPTLVLLHEGLGSVSTWRDFPEELARACSAGVLVYSRYGYGRSDPAPVPRSLRYMHDEALRALPEVLAHTGVRDAVLVGHSDGASIALIHAGSPVRAGCVRGLALLAPHVFVENSRFAPSPRPRKSSSTGSCAPGSPATTPT